MPVLCFCLDLEYSFQLPLKLDIQVQLLRGYLASPNQTFMPTNSFEVFGEDFEDVPGKILLWGNINLSSPMKYLSFEIL